MKAALDANLLVAACLTEGLSARNFSGRPARGNSS
jgi:hypothetical protein